MNAANNQSQFIQKRSKRWAPRVRTGCLTCRARRVKCDETKPICRRCFDFGRDCQGYMLTTKPSALLCIAPAMNPVPQLNCSQEVQDIVLLLPKINDSFAYISDNIQRKVCIKVVLLLEHLPCRAGYSAALDAAVRFVASGIRDVWIRKDDFKSGQARLSPESPEHLSLYSPAVSALRQALEDPNKSLEAETLFAAFLLCCFDSFNDDNFQISKQHLIDISKIIKHQGPSRYSNSFELDILYHSLQLIFVTSSHSGKNGFLNSAERYIERLAAFGFECSSLVKHYHYHGTVPRRWRHAVLKKMTDSEGSFVKWFYSCTRNLAQTGDGTDAIALIKELHQSDERRPLIEAVGGCLLGLIISQRLRVAIGCNNSYEVETQVQDLTRRLEALHEEYRHDKTFTLPFNLTVL